MSWADAGMAIPTNSSQTKEKRRFNGAFPRPILLRPLLAVGELHINVWQQPLLALEYDSRAWQTSSFYAVPTMMHPTGIRSRTVGRCDWDARHCCLAGPVVPQAQPAPPSRTTTAARATMPADVLPSPQTDRVHSPLGEAIALARKGDCDAAIKKYQQVLQEKPKSPDAYAGMARCYLRNERCRRSLRDYHQGLQVADGVPVREALGEVYFRQGKIPEAEKEWVGIINSGRKSARAYYGLARARRAIEMNKSAKAMIDKAYRLDPDDPDIRRHWMGTLELSERIKYYEDQVVDANNSSAAEREQFANSLGATQGTREAERPSLPPG